MNGYQLQAGMPPNRQALQPGQWPGFARGGMQSFNVPGAPFTQPAAVPAFAHPGFSPLGPPPGQGSIVTQSQPGFMARPPIKQRPESHPESRPPGGFKANLAPVSELRTTQMEERAVGAARVSQTRPSGLTATFVRLQQEIQSQALHEASMLDGMEEKPKTQHKEVNPQPHAPQPHPHAYLERRLQWIQEDLQRQQTRLLEQSVPKEDPMRHQERMSSAVEMLQKMQIERRAREALENKIAGLESALMKERAEHNLSVQQMRQKYEQVMSGIGAGFEMQVKSANDRLLRQSQHLEQKIKDLFHTVEHRLASRSQNKGRWTPINLDKGENGTMPSWSDLGARIAQEQRQGNAQRPHGMPSMATVPEAFPSHPPSKPTSGSVLVQANRAAPKSQVGGSMRVPKSGAQVAQGDGAAISGKALGEMLQRLHQENQELQRVNQELSQQRLSRKGSKEASMTHSPIQTPGGGKYAQWPLYRPAG